MTANVWQSKLHMKRVCLCGEFYGYSLFDYDTKNRVRERGEERVGGTRGEGGWHNFSCVLHAMPKCSVVSKTYFLFTQIRKTVANK